MARNRSTPEVYLQPYRYPSPNVPLAAIRRFARRIAARFEPERIILFGSYAYGTPHVESDVDLLVIMPAHDVVNQAIRIDLALEAPFSLDLIVRTPKHIERGLRDNDWFLREIVEKGKVLYEAANVPVGTQGRGRLGGSQKARQPQAAAARQRKLPLSANGRKVLQGAAAGSGAVIPKTYDLRDLQKLLLPNYPTAATLRRGLRSLTRYAVEYRYPGVRATTRRMIAALRYAKRIRAWSRACLGLPADPKTSP